MTHYATFRSVEETGEVTVHQIAHEPPYSGSIKMLCGVSVTHPNRVNIRSSNETARLLETNPGGYYTWSRPRYCSNCRYSDGFALARYDITQDERIRDLEIDQDIARDLFEVLSEILEDDQKEQLSKVLGVRSRKYLVNITLDVSGALEHIIEELDRGSVIDHENRLGEIKDEVERFLARETFCWFPEKGDRKPTVENVTFSIEES